MYWGYCFEKLTKTKNWEKEAELSAHVFPFIKQKNQVVLIIQYKFYFTIV